MLKQRCDISIDFDNPTRRYKAGEEVRGQVRVTVNDDCECRELDVSCQWRTHGEGNPTTGKARSKTLFSGHWTAGETHTYPFHFRLPNGPISYHGTVLNVDWRINARADVALARDPRAQADFVVEAGPATSRSPYLIGDPDRAATIRSRGEDSLVGLVLGLLFATALVLLGVFVGGLLLIDGFSTRSPTPFFGGLVLLALPVAAGIFLARIVAGNRIAALKLRDIDVRLSQSYLLPGQSFEVRLAIPPRARGPIRNVTALLIGKEIVVAGVGQHRQTRSHLLTHTNPTILKEHDFRPGERTRFTHTLTIPHDAPPSFHTYERDLDWRVEVCIELDRWPDWKTTLPIEVHPHPTGTDSW